MLTIDASSVDMKTPTATIRNVTHLLVVIFTCSSEADPLEL